MAEQNLFALCVNKWPVIVDISSWLKPLLQGKTIWFWNR